MQFIHSSTIITLDRWFNPFVHDQALCRVYRIGQTKPVTITYLDAHGTVDEVMKHINGTERGGGGEREREKRGAAREERVLAVLWVS